eukprot:jgi/Tetstr1/434831/TSEL_002548.t2
MGPAWDYNESFGLCCGFPFEGYDQGGGVGNSPEGWRFRICEVNPEVCVFDPVDGISWWFQAAWKSAAFRSSASKRWQQLRQGKLTDAWVKTIFDGTARNVRAASGRTLDRWEEILAHGNQSPALDQWDYNVSEMRAWLLRRLKWLDSAFDTN